ncbi:MalY/PatB family protein [Sulfuricystis multivorans]|uniref:MalY/PatB family protein n=1 Tax=Sulfuricystis multivorans TaxID=2211108 RepID=UPI000F825089|nr:PatB family C-S lyase [Sulfuricystis multivorans]
MSFEYTPPQDSVRWRQYAGRDVIPLTVADMDFPAPPAVVEALAGRIASGLFGYGEPWPSLLETIIDHCAREYGWLIEADWIVWLPGLVPGLHAACCAVGREGDGVFTATPVYPPFLSAPLKARRRLLTLPLVRSEAGWGWDFAAADAIMRSARLFLLCHPHNPVGRAWRTDELWQLAALVDKHDLVVCSDEIHCDLTLTGRHTPFATLAPEIAARTITLMAPSKTFNLAGLGCAWAIIPDAALRRAFEGAARGIVPQPNLLGLIACEAALREGGAWRAQLLDTLRSHAARVEQVVNALPGLSMERVEASFLAWLDCRELGVARPATFFAQAGVGVSDGAAFGPGEAYAQYVRLNFATTRTLLDLALERIRKACTG